MDLFWKQVFSYRWPELEFQLSRTFSTINFKRANSFLRFLFSIFFLLRNGNTSYCHCCKLNASHRRIFMAAISNLFIGCTKTKTMDKILTAGQTPDWVFDSRPRRACVTHTVCSTAKRPNLKLKTWQRQFLSYLLQPFVLTTNLKNVHFVPLLRMTFALNMFYLLFKINIWNPR